MLSIIEVFKIDTCVAGALKEAGIPFIEADSTMMIWVDLRKFLEAPTWEAERKLWHRLADEQRVILTPGSAANPTLFYHTSYRNQKIPAYEYACRGSQTEA